MPEGGEFAQLLPFIEAGSISRIISRLGDKLSGYELLYAVSLRVFEWDTGMGRGIYDVVAVMQIPYDVTYS